MRSPRAAPPYQRVYWKLWYIDDQSLSQVPLCETFVGPEVTISHTVDRFCTVFENNQERDIRTEAVQAPMDFAFVTGWQAIMKAIFPAEIDGDLLKLVHLTNDFKMIDGARTLQATSARPRPIPSASSTTRAARPSR